MRNALTNQLDALAPAAGVAARAVATLKLGKAKKAL